MVIVRCCGPDCFYLERVVFPFELLSFQCPALSQVEIWTHGLGGADLVESLSVDELFVEPHRSLASAAVLETLPNGPELSPWLKVG